MTDRRWVRLAVVPVLAAVAAAVPHTAAAAAPPDLYVAPTGCDAGNDGSAAEPFCKISDALAVVEPGQTVLVRPGAYTERMTITRSGTPTAPITIRAVHGPGHVRVGEITGTTTNPILTLSGVHDVVVEGFTIRTQTSPLAVLVEGGSTRVTLDGISTTASASASVRVAGDSSDVTISRGWFPGSLPGRSVAVAIEAGATDTVISGNAFRYGGVSATDAPGTRVVGNTVVTACTPGIVLAGASAGADVRNNIVRTGNGTIPAPAACSTPANAVAVSLSPGSLTGSTADYNLIDPASGGPLYRWGATDHASIAAFRTATGQGAHDIAAPALLADQIGNERGYLPLNPLSPAVDSADAVTARDLLGNPHADAPTVNNTGTGNGFHDRGAVELQGPVTVTGPGLRRVPGGHQYDVEAPLSMTTAWTVDGPLGKVARSFDGQGHYTVGPIASAVYRFPRAGYFCANHYVSFNDFRGALYPLTYERCVVLGARFTATPPTRVLDTRAAVGVDTTTPIGPGGEVVLTLPTADVTAAVLNLTVTRPTANGHVTVYPDGVSPQDSSNVNFVTGETVANLAMVPVVNGKLRIRHTGPGTVHVVADLQGYYTATGQRYKPVTPTRVLDTRAGTAGAVAAGGDRTLDLTGAVPAGATAAIVNVTVTRPAAAGHLNVYPDGTTRPEASNLNFGAGQTIPNLVVVPLTDGKARIHNASAGTVHVVADLAGWFGPTATDEYVPFGPTRIVDTRQFTPVGAFGTQTVEASFYDSWLATAVRPTALVANLTVTRPTAAGHLSAYPASGPPSGSNVNFVAGETAANFAVPRTDASARILVQNNSAGNTHVIVDQAGYFIPGV